MLGVKTLRCSPVGDILNLDITTSDPMDFHSLALFHLNEHFPKCLARFRRSRAVWLKYFIRIPWSTPVLVIEPEVGTTSCGCIGQGGCISFSRDRSREKQRELR